MTYPSLVSHIMQGSHHIISSHIRNLIISRICDIMIQYIQEQRIVKSIQELEHIMISFKHITPSKHMNGTKTSTSSDTTTTTATTTSTSNHTNGITSSSSPINGSTSSASSTSHHTNGITSSSFTLSPQLFIDQLCSFPDFIANLILLQHGRVREELRPR